MQETLGHANLKLWISSTSVDLLEARGSISPERHTQNAQTIETLAIQVIHENVKKPRLSEVVATFPNGLGVLVHENQA